MSLMVMDSWISLYLARKLLFVNVDEHMIDWEIATWFEWWITTCNFPYLTVTRNVVSSSTCLLSFIVYHLHAYEFRKI